jgi:FkbM family methyltransferase
MSRLTRWLRSDPPPPPPTPYEHLFKAPRYVVRTEDLAGEPFQIPDGISFYYGYREIFQDEIYRFNAASRVPRIIDCGSHCGLSIVYFKQLYPDARIVAIEADPQIFDLLTLNVRQFRFADVTLVNKAIALEPGEVTFHREGANAGRIHALADAKETITVPTLPLDDLLTEPVDLLKIDIEGVETEVLCASRRLGNVAQLIVEYHSFADSSQSLHQLLKKLSDHGFRYKVQTQFCPRRPLVDDDCHLGMDLQLNIYAKRPAAALALSAA